MSKNDKNINLKNLSDEKFKEYILQYEEKKKKNYDDNWITTFFKNEFQINFNEFLAEKESREKKAQEQKEKVENTTNTTNTTDATATINVQEIVESVVNKFKELEELKEIREFLLNSKKEEEIVENQEILKNKALKVYNLLEAEFEKIIKNNATKYEEQANKVIDYEVSTAKNGLIAKTEEQIKKLESKFTKREEKLKAVDILGIFTKFKEEIEKKYNEEIKKNIELYNKKLEKQEELIGLLMEQNKEMYDILNEIAKNGSFFIVDAIDKNKENKK